MGMDDFHVLCVIRQGNHGYETQVLVADLHGAAWTTALARTTAEICVSFERPLTARELPGAFVFVITYRRS
jgi:hypothetical protein